MQALHLPGLLSPDSLGQLPQQAMLLDLIFVVKLYWIALLGCVAVLVHMAAGNGQVGIQTENILKAIWLSADVLFEW